MKRITISILFLLLFCIITTGCNSQTVVEPERLPTLINENVELTNKAIAEKDIKLTRQIWSQISEYGVKAKELGKEDLADNLGKLAASYSCLVEYFQTGNVQQLDLFNEGYNQALDKIREYVKTEKSKNEI